jgi:methyl-accepting chemotaxis protein
MTARKKIILGFVSVFVVGMVIAIYSLCAINSIMSMSQVEKKFSQIITKVSDTMTAHLNWRHSLTVAVYTGADFSGSLDPSACALGVFKQDRDAISLANDDIRQMLIEIDVPHNFIHNNAKKVLDLQREGKETEAYDFFEGQILPQITATTDILADIQAEYHKLMEGQETAISEFVSHSQIVIIVMLIAAVLIDIVLAIIITRLILIPIRVLADQAAQVAAGNLNVSIQVKTHDEIGRISGSFKSLIAALNILVRELNGMGRRFTELGDIDARIDTASLSGSYKEVGDNVNLLVSGIMDELMGLFRCMKSFSDGDFSAGIARLPGKKAVFNETLDHFKENIRLINGTVMGLVRAAAEGKLSSRADTSRFNGEWAKLMEELNLLLTAIVEPINEAAAVLGYVSDGDFSHKIVGSYKGDFLKIKESINSTVTNVSSYIGEISCVLSGLANNDLNQEIKRPYVGSFSEIKDALNNIINTLNIVIGDINAVAEQVDTGAKQISESAMALAQGATEQATAVEELTATVISVNEKTQKNADNSNQAANLVEELIVCAREGNDQMKGMLKSMGAITEASGSIARIIDIIKGIAFQTNLLALNASIEAAHAGVHGAGFSVVAEEVRGLAAKSQEAANDTTQLIETSIKCVTEGTGIAVRTDQALERIVSHINSVSAIISGISAASNEQAIAISQINDGVGHIAEVVQDNSATSEESAAAAQELSSQSDVMRSLVNVFSLRASKSGGDPKSRIITPC